MPSDRNKLVAISPLDMPTAMQAKTSCSRLVRACRTWAACWLLGGSGDWVAANRRTRRLVAREGAAVACADRDADAAEATAALVRNEGQIAAVVLTDVASPDDCASVVTDSATALGGMDGLVLNVGLGLGRGMAGTTAAQWDETFAVNTRAHFLVAAAALQVLDPGSAIVFISSAASMRAATGIPAYDASKAALAALCRLVAREGMARGIRANLVVPSLVDTPLGRDASRLNPGRTARSLPFGRQATAWEVAYATVWLLSEESSYVNAHPLVLDGGATSFGLPRAGYGRGLTSSTL